MLKFNQLDYMMRCVIQNTVHAKTLIFAVKNDFVGDKKKRLTEAESNIEASISLLKEVLDNIVWDVV